MPSQRVIVGTAGHIDHGKTRLVEALTGIDCDRWAEEKQRGITIDLGFAHLEEGDLQLGFVDVPGHERFLHNALAGLGGIRIMLLVVAADEGVKPQTREHLDIVSLLGIPSGLVVLTKADLVDGEVLEMARLEVEELLRASPFAGAPVLAASSATGKGVREVRAKLLELAARYPATLDPERPARLPIDRAFLLKGLGLVVTGTMADGTVSAGDTLELLPTAERVRVRNVQVHGHDRGQAEAGERVAVQLAGIDHSRVLRGMELIAPGGYAVTYTLAADLTLLPAAPEPIRRSTPVRLHLLAAERVGQLRPLAGPIEPGASGPVEIRLRRPLVARRGDRFVVRRPSPALTLGGGRILDPGWRRRRRGALGPILSALAGDDDEVINAWVTEAGEGGVEGARLARRLGLDAEATGRRLERLAANRAVLRVPAGLGHGERWLDPACFAEVEERARELLSSYFDANRLATSMPRAELVERLLSGRAAELADVYLDRLEREGVLARSGSQVAPPDRTASMTGEETQLADRLLATFEEGGLTPPAPTGLAAELTSHPKVVEGVLGYLLEQGKLVRLPGGLLIAAKAIEELRRDLAEEGWDRFQVSQFKDRYALSRKWAIPLLEHLDSTGVTRRVGNERVLVRDPSSAADG